MWMRNKGFTLYVVPSARVIFIVDLFVCLERSDTLLHGTDMGSIRHGTRCGMGIGHMDVCGVGRYRAETSSLGRNTFPNVVASEHGIYAFARCATISRPLTAVL